MADKITADMAGTWLESSQGWHNSYRVIDRAVEWGMTLTDDDRAIVDAYRNGAESLTLSTGETVTADDIHSYVIDQGELSDRATEYLQSLAPEGYAFVWDVGELSLQNDVCSYSTVHNGERWCDTHDSTYPCLSDTTDHS